MESHELTIKTLDELKSIAKLKGVSGYSKMKKQDLLDRLSSMSISDTSTVPSAGSEMTEKPRRKRTTHRKGVEEEELMKENKMERVDRLERLERHDREERGDRPERSNRSERESVQRSPEKSRHPVGVCKLSDMSCQQQAVSGSEKVTKHHHRKLVESTTGTMIDEKQAVSRLASPTTVSTRLSKSLDLDEVSKRVSRQQLLTVAHRKCVQHVSVSSSKSAILTLIVEQAIQKCLEEVLSSGDLLAGSDQ